MTDQTKVTQSLNLAEMSLEQLVQLSQGFGHQVERIRQMRLHINAHIAKRIAAGERTCTELLAAEAAAAAAAAQEPAAPVPDSIALEPGDAIAPGAVIEVSATATAKG